MTLSQLAEVLADDAEHTAVELLRVRNSWQFAARHGDDVLPVTDEFLQAVAVVQRAFSAIRDQFSEVK